MKKLVLLSVLLLSACQSVQPYYEQQNFQPTGWAKKSFEEAKAACRYQTLDHNALWDTYELQTPRYKACMEQEGFRFTAATDWTGNVQPSGSGTPLQPRVQTTATMN